MFNIVLVEPEIPENTGNISRTCAVTGAALHLVRPLGFSTDDKHLKRAGLDYWKYLSVTYYDSFEELTRRRVSFLHQRMLHAIMHKRNIMTGIFWCSARKQPAWGKRCLHAAQQMPCAFPCATTGAL